METPFLVSPKTTMILPYYGERFAFSKRYAPSTCVVAVRLASCTLLPLRTCGANLSGGVDRAPCRRLPHSTAL